MSNVRKKTVQKLLMIIIVSVLAAASVFADESNQQQLDKDIPRWSLQNQQGEWFNEASYLGKPLIISVWGTWCHYCKRLHPELQRIYEKYNDDGLEIVAISVNEQPDANPAEELLSRGITFPTLVNGDDVAVNVFDAFGTPLTLFVRPDGSILGRTMLSDPEDQRFEKTAEYLVSLAKQ